MICQTARYATLAEGLDEALAAIKEFTEYVSENEEGTVRYDVYRGKADPLSFLHVIHFRDEVAHAAHGNSNAVQRFQGRLYPQLEAPVQFDEYELFTSR